MFEPKTETVTVSGEELVIQEITAGQLNEMGDSASDLVAAGIKSPPVTIEQVNKWPSSIVMAIADLVSKLNGFDQGNA